MNNVIEAIKNKDSSESECRKVILQPNINFVRWSCDHDLTNQQRMSSRHCTNIVEDVSQTRPRQACVSLTCPQQYQDISNLLICLDLPARTLSAYKKL